MAVVQAFGGVKSLWESLPTQNCWIAGGAMRSWLTGERVKDVDLFSSDPEAVISAIELNDSYKAGFRNDFIANFYKGAYCFQVIKKYPFKSQKETIDNFDFTIICASYGPDGLVVDDRFYIDNAQRRLVIKSLPKPLSTIKRALKFAGHGYAMCPVALATILKQIQKNPIDWSNPDENEIELYPDGTPTFRGLD